MRAIYFRRICAGLIGSVLAVPAAAAQQTGTSGAAQTGGTATTATQSGTTQSGTPTTGSSNYGGTSTQGSGNDATGMRLPQTTLGGGATTSSQSGNTAGRRSTGRTRAGGTTGQRGGASMGLGSLGGGQGRVGGGQSSAQMNRQSERKAQAVTRLDPVSFASSTSIEPGSTLQLRSTVEQSIAVAVPSGVQVGIDGSTVVLSGKVSNAAESKLAERMALLEPGVRSVRNELVVAAK